MTNPTAPKPVTREEIETWKKLEAAATPMPWFAPSHPRIDSPSGAVTVYPPRAFISDHDRVLTIEARNAFPRLIAEVERLTELVTRKDGPCYYCGRPTNSLSADPADWPILLAHADDPGKAKPHHRGCIDDRLAELHNVTEANNANRRLLGTALKENERLRKVEEAARALRFLIDPPMLVGELLALLTPPTQEPPHAP